MKRSLLPNPVRLCAASACVLIASVMIGRAATPDFANAHADLVPLLQGFIRVDTSNPPGNETAGAKYLQAYLATNGIPSEIYEKEAGRGNLVARLKGSGKKKPLMLMGHTDVVGVERDKWTVPPFAGLIKDGFLYGRGASDDKAMTAVCAQLLVLLKQSGLALDRDVIFMANAGEEGTTHVGIDFMVREHWDKIACEFAINEGGALRERDGKIHYVGIATGEKVPRPGILYAKGTGGHGSRPLADNAVVHLADAVAKIGKWQAPMRLNDTTRLFMKRLAAISPADEAFLYSNVEDPVLGAMVQEKLRVSKPNINSMLRTSLAPTMMKGGYRINVIPGDANAQVDIRLLPDEDFPAFEALVRKVIDNPRVEFVLSDGSRQPSPPSPVDSELFKAFENQQAKLFPGSTTLPMMLTGATDSAQMRAKGVHAYGIGTVISEEDSLKIHGHDERIPVAGLKTFLEYLHGVVVDVAAVK